MNPLNVDWSGRLSQVAKASSGVATKARSHASQVTASEPYDLRLTGKVGAIAWAVILAFIFYCTRSVVLVGVVTFFVARRLDMQPKPFKPKPPKPFAFPPPTLPKPAPVVVPNETSVTGVQLSVYQSCDGPTVSVLTFPHGEIHTRVCASWPAAGAYAGRIKKKWTEAGVPVEFVEERI